MMDIVFLLYQVKTDGTHESIAGVFRKEESALARAKNLLLLDVGFNLASKAGELEVRVVTEQDLSEPIIVKTRADGITGVYHKESGGVVYFITKTEVQ